MPRWTQKMRTDLAGLELRSIRAVALSPMSATIVITNTAPTAHTAFLQARPLR
jgi:hypothetical protein